MGEFEIKITTDPREIVQGRKLPSRRYVAPVSVVAARLPVFAISSSPRKKATLPHRKFLSAATRQWRWPVSRHLSAIITRLK